MLTALWKMRFASLVQLAGLGVLGAFETVHMQNHGLSEAQIGQVLALENGLMIVTALGWGRVADQTRWFRGCIIGATLGLVVTLGWFAQAETLGDFMIYGVLRGVCMTGIAGLMPALALANLDPAKPGRGFGGYRRYGSIGFMVATSGLPLMFDSIAAMAVAAAVMVPLSIWFVQALRDPEAPTESEAMPSLTPGGGRAAMGMFLVAHFFVSMSDPAVHGFYNTFARELGASVQWVGILSGMTGAIALLTLGYMGDLADRIGAAKLLVAGFVAQGVRMGCASLITDPNWLWLPHMFHALGWAGKEVGTLLFLTALLGKTRLGMASSLMMSVRMMGMMVGSYLMGWLAETQGYPVMFRVIAALVGVGLLALLVTFRLQRRAPVRSGG